MSKDFSLEEALTPAPQEEFGLSDLLNTKAGASSSEEGMRNYVPRQSQGPARTVQGKTYPKKQAAPVENTTGVMGDDLGSAIMDVAQPKRESVMEGVKVPPLPTEDQAVVNPQFTAAVKAQLDAMPAEQRQAALDKMAQRPDVYGRAARAIAGRYAAEDQNQTPTTRKFDPRLEAQTERFAEDNRYDPESLARAQAASGQLFANPAQLKEAPEEYIAKQQGVKPPTYGETIGANFAGGFADAILGATAALSDYVRASDTADQLDATRKSVKEFQSKYGGDTTLGRVSSMVGGLTPALVETMAAPYTGGASLIPLLSTGVLFALPGFRDTYKEQLKAGAPQSVAVEHALASAGMMMYGGRLIATGGKVLPEALQASDKLLPQLTSAAAEGALFNAADSATHKGIDVVNGRNTDSPVVDPQSMVENALAFAVLRGAHKGIEHTQGKQVADERVPYMKDSSYEGLAELIAKSKGFLTPEQQQRQEQKAPPAPATDLGAVGEARPGEDLTPPQAPVVPKDERVAQLAEEIQKRTNIPIENATRIAEERLAAEEGTNAPAQAETQGEPNVGQTITKPSGASIPVVEQPSTELPPGRAGVTERGGVVSAGQDVARVNERAPAQPAPIGKTLIEELQDLHTQGKVTPEDIEKVRNWMKAEDSAIDFGKKLFGLINEIERRPTAEEAAPVEEAKAEEPAPVEEAKVDPIAFAQRSADSAIAGQGDFESLEESIGAHRDNIADTLREQGIDDQPTIDKAIATYDDEINKAKQKQPAPAAETPAETKRRGRPPLERTEEQKQKLEGDKKQRKKDTDNADYQLKKLNKMLDEALKPVDEELEADKVDQAEEDKEKAKKYVATQLLELNLNPNLRGTAVGNRVKALLNDRSKLSQADIDAAKRGMEIRAKTDLRGEIGESFQGKSPLASRIPVKGKPNTAFNRATNASQALTIVAKTGNAFQKSLANRLRAFTNGVTFVVLEKDDPMPPALREAMRSANGLYSRGTKTVYVRGESWGSGHGINNITVLHELLHAATDRRIALAKFGKSSALVKELTDLADRVKRQYELMDRMNLVPDELKKRIEATIVTDADGTVHYDIFKTPQEFLAYGMSDEVFQEFLGRVKGTQNENGFSSFVRTLYNEWAKAFGKGKDEFSAMSDLINITDKILDEKAPAGELAARTFASEEPKEPLERTAHQLQQATSRALRGVALSRAGNELGKSVSIAAALRDPRILWRETKLVWDSLSDSARTVFSHAYDLEAIAKGPGERIQSLQDLYEAIQKKNGMTESILRSVANQSEQIVRFYNAHPKFKDVFNDLVHASTNAEYDPSKPNNTHRDKTLDAMYNALPERGKELYKNLRDYYTDMKDFQRQIISDQIDKLDLPAGERDKVMAGIREIFEGDKTIDPYFPLMRYGDYVLEFGKGDKRTSVRFETKIERDRAALEYAKSKDISLKYLRDNGYVKISDDIGGSRMRSTIESTSKLLKAAYEAVDTANITEPGAKEAIKDNIYQAYLAAMPEASVRKMFMHRKGTPGYSSDVLRNVNAVGIKMSRQFPNLRYGPSIRSAVDGAYKAIADDPTYKAFVQRAAELAANSLSPPEKTTLAKFYDSAAGLVTKAAYLRYMTSWSSAIMQPMDIFLKGVPMMLANHGPRGLAEMSKMLKFWNQYGVIEHQADGTTRWRMPSIEHATGLTPTERRAIRDIGSYGVFKDTLASTVFSQAKKPVTSTGVRMAKDVTSNLIFGGLMHHGERLSREFLGLASFRANMEKFGGDYDKAIRAAVDETYEAFGNYSPDNRPLLMQGAGGKVLTMYKFFPLVTYKNLASNFFKMLPGFNKEDKAKAATKFFGILGTHLLLGGLEALPLFTTIMAIIGAAWNKWGRDPDAPDEMKNLDYLTWWKTEFMPQQFGDEWSETLKKGVANKFAGIDLSSRVSLDNMWFREPNSPGKTNKDTFLNWALALGGPVPNLAINTMNGLQDLANGEYQRGMEKLTPGSISNYMIAYRYATQGIQTPQGVQLAEPGKVPTSEIVGQAIGYRPAALSTAQDLANRGAVVEKQIAMEKQNLEQQYKDNFRKSIDPTIPLSAQERFGNKWVDTFDKIIDFNLRNPTKQIDMDELENANAENINKVLRKGIFGGIDINEKNAALLGPVSNEAEKALSVYNKP